VSNDVIRRTIHLLYRVFCCVGDVLFGGNGNNDLASHVRDTKVCRPTESFDLSASFSALR